MNEHIAENLRTVYGESAADYVRQELAFKAERFRAEYPDARRGSAEREAPFSERDVVLITYGDQICEPGVPPLRTLDEVLTERVRDVVNTVHILPFYPYTSDDGFSVTDYLAVNPALGDWQDVRRMGARFRLMFDAVINHMSRSSEWFQAYLRDEEGYAGFFISVDPEADLSDVVRPRTSPLLTPFESVDGVRYVWTTFSADQVDLNYADPDLLLRIVDVLLTYVAMGAKLIRLDAVAFLWKEVGTSCLHLPQTHAIIRFLRALLDEVAPGVILITETNVPHTENVSYFGDGHNEAHMVYNFTLPPLALHAFHSGDARRLSAWASTLETPSDETAFFNFMASHDGVGLRPLEGILSADEVDALAQRAKAHGGYVSYRTNADGTESPYELNIVYYDALNDPQADEPQSLQVARFLCSQAILLCMAGVPGIYVHSLFGSRNWRSGVALTGHNRTINRRKFHREDLEAELADPDTVSNQVFAGYRRLLEHRIAEPAFHPAGDQRVVDVDPALFVLMRTAPGGTSAILCVHNVTRADVDAVVEFEALGWAPETELIDVLTDRRWRIDGSDRVSVKVPAYSVLWLKPT